MLDQVEDFIHRFETSEKDVLPIRIGEKVIGETRGDVDSGDYEFRIWDRDFLNKLGKEPVESGPNENDRSLFWKREKPKRKSAGKLELRDGVLVRESTEL